MYDTLKNFDWRTLRSIYGSSHSSIIGFISYEWVKLDPLEHKVLDGPPSPNVGGGRKGQINSDLLLLEDESPKVIVEVETVNWLQKIDNLNKYLKTDDYKDAKGLLVLTTVKEGNRVDDLEKVRRIIKSSQNLSLVEIWREKRLPHADTFFRRSQKKTSYYQWGVREVRYWDRLGGRILWHCFPWLCQLVVITFNYCILLLACSIRPSKVGKSSLVKKTYESWSYLSSFK